MVIRKNIRFDRHPCQYPQVEPEYQRVVGLILSRFSVTRRALDTVHFRGSVYRWLALTDNSRALRSRVSRWCNYITINDMMLRKCLA